MVLHKDGCGLTKSKIGLFINQSLRLMVHVLWPDIIGWLDWDHRTQMSNRGWDQNVEMWKNQSAGGGMEVQLGQQKDGYPG
ncbi:hypothetical protein M8C21_012830 [Ambrosia artemisiifolia]|uniref:Uncharacterized protein n=1 Tax=Ambrosia artemisiifolia TaxID=4212 RepID=A0AAD5CZT9_AMBAR|nr:hypothetical protein M8C21_012830 [Ambrosia artemisiifolia]